MKLLLLPVYLISFFIASSQHNTLMTVIKNPYASDCAYDVELDAFGKVWVLAEFSGTGWDSKIVLGKDTVKLPNYANLPVVIEFDKSGNIHKTFAARTNNDASLGVTTTLMTDAGGNIYLAGTFNGDGVYFRDSLISQQGFGIFVLKMDSLGTVKWVRKVRTEIMSKLTMTAGPANSVYLGFNQTKTSLIGSDSTILQGTRETVLARFSETGSLDFIKKISHGGQSNCTGLYYAGGSLYLGGDTWGSVSFINETVSGTAVPFLLKTDANGEFGWIYTGTAGFSIKDLDRDAFGDFYLCGGSIYNSKNLLIKVSSEGVLKGKMETLDQDNFLLFNDITVQGENIYVVGNFSKQANFTSIDFISGPDTWTSFIARYKINGAFVSAKAMPYQNGSKGNDYTYAVDADSLGNVFSSGYISENHYNTSQRQDFVLNHYYFFGLGMKEQQTPSPLFYIRYNLSTPELVFNQTFTGRVQIYSVTGQAVFNMELRDENVFSLPQNFAPGLYVIMARDMDRAQGAKLLIR